MIMIVETTKSRFAYVLLTLQMSNEMLSLLIAFHSFKKNDCLLTFFRKRKKRY